jgi:hypothetical protein
MRRLAAWYPSCREIPLEATGGFAALPPRRPPRVAAFLSGGVDSLSMLRANRAAAPQGDPASIREAIHLFGWHTDDFVGQVPRPERLRHHEESASRLARLAETEDVVLLPVRTNARTFHPRFSWTRDVGFGAGMIAAAHALRGRFTAVHFASGGFPGEHPPHGSHPDLDPLFSSGALEVVHAEPRRTRLEKVRALAAWPAAMSVLEVCLHHGLPAPGVVNCGRCEKCVRTLLELAAVGGLDGATTFPERGLLESRLAKARFEGGHLHAYLRETVDGLAANGRGDLVEALLRKMSEADGRARRRGRWWRRLARAARRWVGARVGGAAGRV